MKARRKLSWGRKPGVRTGQDASVCHLTLPVELARPIRDAGYTHVDIEFDDEPGVIRLRLVRYETPAGDLPTWLAGDS